MSSADYRTALERSTPSVLDVISLRIAAGNARKVTGRVGIAFGATSLLLYAMMYGVDPPGSPTMGTYELQCSRSGAMLSWLHMRIAEAGVSHLVKHHLMLLVWICPVWIESVEQDLLYGVLTMSQ
jgi:hypothetical protein